MTQQQIKTYSVTEIKKQLIAEIESLKTKQGYVLAGGREWKLAWFKSVTLEYALKVHSAKQFSDNSIKKVWKIANGLTKPNYLEK